MKKLSVVFSLGLFAACSTPPHHGLSGIYQGTLPCGDCEKIEAKLTLNSDSSYQYHTVYHKNNGQYAFLEVGTYQWDHNKPNTLRLRAFNTTQSDILPDIVFKVTDNKLEMCDAEGNTTAYPHHHTLHRISP